MRKPRRSMLFIPGSNAAMLSTAFVYRPDSIMFDLEDAVSLRAKDSARLLVYHALQLGVYREMETVVRINPLDTPYGIKDLEAAVRGGADIVRLPKTDSAEDVLRLECEVDRIEQECGRKPGSTRLMAAIESASGVVNALSIATASPRMDLHRPGRLRLRGRHADPSAAMAPSSSTPAAPFSTPPAPPKSTPSTWSFPTSTTTKAF